MPVGAQEQPLLRLAARVTPDRRVREKEALVGREAVDGRLRLRLQGLLQREVRDLDASQVREVLTERELAVHVDAVHASEGIELLLHARGPLPVAPGILGGPPVVQVALRIEAAPAVVEAVRDLWPITVPMP